MCEVNGDDYVPDNDPYTLGCIWNGSRGYTPTSNSD